MDGVEGEMPSPESLEQDGFESEQEQEGGLPDDPEAAGIDDGNGDEDNNESELEDEEEVDLDQEEQESQEGEGSPDDDQFE